MASPITIATATPATSITIRPRQTADIDQCNKVLKAVYATSGYPVEGVENTKDFFADSSCIRSWVAETASITDKDSVGTKAIIGHIALSAASEANFSVALWYTQNPSERQAGRTAVLGRLFVDPEARGSGAGTKLIGAAVEEARAQGLRLVMFALVKDEAAIRLYDRLGWQRFGEGVHKWRDLDGRERKMSAICFAGPE